MTNAGTVSPPWRDRNRPPTHGAYHRTVSASSSPASRASSWSAPNCSPDDPQRTLSNLVAHESLARLGIALELGIVLSQALTAVCGIDTLAAGSLALFGIANAVAILGSAALLATALDMADDASLAVTGGRRQPSNCCTSPAGISGESRQCSSACGDPDGPPRDPLSVDAAASGLDPDRGRHRLPRQPLRDLPGPACRPHVRAADSPSDVAELWIMGYLIVVGVNDHALARSGANGVQDFPGVTGRLAPKS